MDSRINGLLTLDDAAVFLAGSDPEKLSPCPARLPYLVQSWKLALLMLQGTPAEPPFIPLYRREDLDLWRERGGLQRPTLRAACPVTALGMFHDNLRNKRLCAYRAAEGRLRAVGRHDRNIVASLFEGAEDWLLAHCPRHNSKGEVVGWSYESACYGLILANHQIGLVDPQHIGFVTDPKRGHRWVPKSGV